MLEDIRAQSDHSSDVIECYMYMYMYTYAYMYEYLQYRHDTEKIHARVKYNWHCDCVLCPLFYFFCVPANYRQTQAIDDLGTQCNSRDKRVKGASSGNDVSILRTYYVVDRNSCYTTIGS